jgi:hypothetical protein
MIGVFVKWNDRRSDSLAGYVIDGNGCHVWIGYRTDDGYAAAKVDGHNRMVHRVRYEREIGPIPEGMVLDHYVCNNGPNGCCNPHHCRPTTQRENVLRSGGLGAQRLAKTHCPKGHPLSGDNLVESTYQRYGRRECRTCHNERGKLRMRRVRGQAQESA